MSPPGENLSRMHALAYVLGQDYIARRNTYIAATRSVAPLSLTPTEEADPFKSCGDYNFTWSLGESTMKAYIGTAFPDIEAMLMSGARDTSQFTATLVPSNNRSMDRYRQRIEAMRTNTRTSLLILNAKSARPYMQCVSVESPQLPGYPKALHSVTCESIEAQFMRAGFEGSPEALTEMQHQLEARHPGALRSENAYATLQELYLPPQVK